MRIIQTQQMSFGQVDIMSTGIVYLSAIIDWHSKAILAHRISNTMDSQLVMSVLNEALER